MFERVARQDGDSDVLLFTRACYEQLGVAWSLLAASDEQTAQLHRQR